MFSKILAFSSATGSAFFFYIYYEQHWRWKDCFNEQGRCFDNDTGLIYLQQAGITWITLAIGFLALAILLFLKCCFRQKRQKTD